MQSVPDDAGLRAAVAMQMPRACWARYYRTPRRLPPRWIVMHCTAGAEGIGKAWDGAVELKNCPPTRKRSCHYFIDTREAVQCVRTTDEAFHAGATANRLGLGIELCGAATQTREQWLDAASLPMLQIAARLVADLCEAYEIPPVALTLDQTSQLHAGITTHALISQAFPKDTDHTDPGAGFPFADFVRAVRLAVS